MRSPDNITLGATSCPIGVPQGSMLRPIFFWLYANDFAQYIGNQNCKIVADDAMIYFFGRDTPEIEKTAMCIKLTYPMVLRKEGQ